MTETYHPQNHVFYPHYYSTYCVHDRHDECRRTCKTCDTPCLCPCHRTPDATQHDATRHDGAA